MVTAPTPNLDYATGLLAMDFASSPQTFGYLQLQIQRLESQLKSEIEARKSADRDLVSAKQTLDETTTTIMRLTLEVTDLKSDLEGKDGYTEDLRGRFKALRVEHEDVVQKLKASEAELKSAQSEASKLREQLEAQAGEASDDWAFLTLKKETDLRLSLQEDVEKLKKERDQKEPLVKIGMDVRLRFLEQAKQCIWYQKRDKFSKHMQEIGNRAAHGGNGEADASLFALSIAPSPPIFLALPRYSLTQLQKSSQIHNSRL